jgi:hypothetical protein
MLETFALYQNIAPYFSKTILRQMSQIIFGILVVGKKDQDTCSFPQDRKGGNYHTIKRFYYNKLCWKVMHWLLFWLKFLKPDHEYLLDFNLIIPATFNKDFLNTHPKFIHKVKYKMIIFSSQSWKSMIFTTHHSLWAYAD